MNAIKRNKLNIMLSKIGIEMSSVLRVDIRLNKIIVHKYKLDGNGHKFLVYDENGDEELATEYEVYKIVLDVDG